MKRPRNKPTINRKIFWVSSSFKEAEEKEKAYWFSQKPMFRLEIMEQLRQLNYGKEASKRLQRIFEVAKRS